MAPGLHKHNSQRNKGLKMQEDIKRLVPEIVWKSSCKSKKTNKGLRRNIRRLAERKGITYEMAILRFYQVKSLKDLDKNLLYSLYKR
jgi:hypothetical protein